jgi:glycosyltransferase involved in cell wall biosynthesis
MRILMLTELYPPVIGGLEMHVKHLSLELARRGHRVQIATSWYPGLPAYAVEDGVEVRRLRGTTHRLPWLYADPRRSYAPPLPDPEMTGALGTLVRQFKPDVVHAHNWMIHSYLPHLRRNGPPLVRTLHQYDLVCVKWLKMHRDQPTCTGPSFFKCVDCAADHFGAVKGAVTVVARTGMAVAERAAVDMFVPVSHAVARGNALAARGVPWRVIPNFLPDEVAVADEASDPRLGDLPSGPFILFVGALRRLKGLEILLEAYRRIDGAPPLVLIGARWPDTPTSLPANVIALHDWSHAAVMAAWQRCLFGVVPSICEDSCPTVLIEAMASGKAVIGSRIGGIVDMIEGGRSGILVTPGDPSELGHAMQRLIEDAALRERLGQAARDRSAAFRAAAVVPQIDHLYGELLERRARTQSTHRRQDVVR